MWSVAVLLSFCNTFWPFKHQNSGRVWCSPPTYSTFMCFRRERDYMILLRTYNCTTIESIGILKSKVFEHYTSICAAREVTGWLSVSSVCIWYYLLSVSVCLSVLYILSVFTALWRINVFIIMNENENWNENESVDNCARELERQLNLRNLNKDQLQE